MWLLSLFASVSPPSSPPLPWATLLERLFQRYPDEAPFLRAIDENKDDDAPRLIYADWLEENGHEEKGALVRAIVAYRNRPLVGWRNKQKVHRALKRGSQLWEKSEEAGQTWVRLIAGIG